MTMWGAMPPNKKEPDPEPTPRDDSCAVCRKEDFRVCACPWGSVFELWTDDIMMFVKSLCPPSGPRGWRQGD